MSTSNRQLPVDHRQELESTPNGDSKTFYDPENKQGGWITSDTVLVIRQ